MSRPNSLRRLIPALVAAALVAGLAAPAHARPVARQGAQAAGWSPLAGLRAYVSRLWSGVAGAPAGGQGLRSLFGAEGASLDPHGGTPAPGAGAAGGAAVVRGQGGA
jgi:hypothetical protein